MRRLLLLLWLAVASAEEVVIEITGGRQAPIPIAILPFGGEPDPAEIVKQDLRRSGLFEPIGGRADQVDLELWRQLGQDFLVEGEATRVGGRVRIRFTLYDLYGERQLAGDRFVEDANRIRQAAHRISDQIFEAILHRPGPFSAHIAFVEREGPLYRLVIADYDGQNGRPILISPEPILSPVFSPDGSRIAYTSLEGKIPAIYLQEIGTGKRRKIAAWAHAPAFSPDGRRLIFAQLGGEGVDLYLYDLLTGGRERLTDHVALDTEPSFSPDGKSVVFTSDRGGSPQLYRLDLESREISRLTFSGRANTAARFLPSGEGLIVLQSGEGGDRLVLFDRKTGRFTPLTQGPGDDGAAVAPGGDLLLYTVEVGGKPQLAIVSVNGRVQEVLPSEHPRAMPAWSPVPP